MEAVTIIRSAIRQLMEVHTYVDSEIPKSADTALLREHLDDVILDLVDCNNRHVLGTALTARKSTVAKLEELLSHHEILATVFAEPQALGVAISSIDRFLIASRAN